jgi:hypothetical protein
MTISMGGMATNRLLDMSVNRLEPRKRHDVVTIPIIWVAVALSLLIHFAALFALLPRMPLLAKDARDTGRTGMLAVDLVPPTRIADAAAATPVPPQPSELASRPRTEPRQKPLRARPAAPKASTPVIAQSKPAPIAVEPAPEPPRIAATPPAAMAPPAPPPAEDLAAYIEARRRARGETSRPEIAGAAKTAEESDLERRDRIVAANLGLDRTPTFGRGPRDAGGMFQVTELQYDHAQFYFFGFDRDIRRNARQLIEVRRGNNSDIRIAVVRRMIAIIRESTSGDFDWISQRLGRSVTLSARAADNAGLEEFIMRDVFPDERRP